MRISPPHSVRARTAVRTMPILVSSRTDNRSDGGTSGQHLAALSDEETVGVSEVVWLPRRSQTAEFRTNIGLVNSGNVDGDVALRLQVKTTCQGRHFRTFWGRSAREGSLKPAVA